MKDWLCLKTKTAKDKFSCTRRLIRSNIVPFWKMERRSVASRRIVFSDTFNLIISSFLFCFETLMNESKRGNLFFSSHIECYMYNREQGGRLQHNLHRSAYLGSFQDHGEANGTKSTCDCSECMAWLYSLYAAFTCSMTLVKFNFRTTLIVEVNLPSLRTVMRLAPTTPSLWMLFSQSPRDSLQVSRVRILRPSHCSG